MNQEILERVLDDANKVVPAAQKALATAFITDFYKNVPNEDLRQHNSSDLCGAALIQWELGFQRKPEQTHVRAYNPHPETHGWQSSHTIVEVVTSDRPFLVKSVQRSLERLGLTVHLTIHPVLALERNRSHKVVSISDDDSLPKDAFMHFQVDKRTDSEELQSIANAVAATLEDVKDATDDWQMMLTQVRSCSETLATTGKKNPQAAEAAAFTQWLAEGHFTLLGSASFSRKQNKLTYNNDGLGLLRNNRKGNGLKPDQAVPINAETFRESEQPLTVTKSEQRSTVHRDAHMDVVTVVNYDKQGKSTGKTCFIGLFTSSIYRYLTSDIPVVNRRAASVMEKSGVRGQTHDTKALQDILETFPRDLLLQCEDEELWHIMRGILNLQDRQRVRLFGHRDTFGRFFNCLVYVPRDKYGRDLRLAVQEILRQTLDGAEVDFDTRFSSHSPLVRINYVVWTQGSANKEIDWTRLEEKLVNVSRGWDDLLTNAVHDHFGEEQGNALMLNYQSAFDNGYKDAYLPATAVYDIERIEQTLSSGQLSMNFYRPPLADEKIIHFKLYSPNQPIALSDALPVMENMGMRVEGERPFRITRADGGTVWLHEFLMRTQDGTTIDPSKTGRYFTETFARVWRNEVENDSFNRLVLGEGIDWRDTVMLRAFCKYMLQIRLPFSQDYISNSLYANLPIAQLLVRLFHARFDPAKQGDTAETVSAIRESLREHMEQVVSLDQDRILRGYANLIFATLRTNFFQLAASGTPKDYVSFKFDPAVIEGMPLPRPMFEIFVCSPRVEGVHLRGGKVARGGLRWSDRREDFRTRDPRFGKSANGQKLGHRAGRLQRRICAQTPANRGWPRSVHGRGDRLLQNLLTGFARFNRQPDRRRGLSTTRRSALRRRRPLSGRCRGQRDGDILGFCQRSLSRIRPLARRRLCLRRLQWL